MVWKKFLKSLVADLLCCALLAGMVFSVPIPAYAAETTADEIVSAMTEREKITQILMPAFRTWKSVGASSSVNVTQLNSELRQVIRDYRFGGVILFAPNLSQTDQMVQLTDDLQNANAAGGNIPLLIATDQEGGSVVRLGSGCRMTGNMALGAANDEQAAYDTGDIMGSELKALGINVDFAPVMDTNDNPKNPVIGLRSFSDDPETVAKLGIPMMEGLHKNNIATALKHFPGHGNTATDSHSTMPIVYKTMDELEKVELAPFQAAMNAGSDMIMTTHIQYPNIITEELPTKNKDTLGNPVMMKPPATLSRQILTNLVRTRMHYTGVIVTDSMGMGGITENFLPEDAAVYAIKAGVDIVLMPVVTQSLSDVRNNLSPVISAIEIRAKTDSDLQSRIEESARRVVQLKITRGLMTLDTTPTAEKISAAKEIVGSDGHHDREREIADSAVTVIKNNANTLPIKPKENQTVLLIGAYSNELPALQFGLEQLINEQKIAKIKFQSMYYYNNRISDQTFQDAIAAADYVIAITETTSEAALSPSSWVTKNPRNIVTWAKAAGKPCVLVSIDKPYDVANYPDADTMLAVYGSSGMDPTEGGVRPATNYGPNIPAALDVIFGAYQPVGTLPVDIPVIQDGVMSTTETQYERGGGLTGDLTRVGKAEIRLPDTAKVSEDIETDVILSDLQNLPQLDSTVEIAYDSENFTVKAQEESGISVGSSTVTVKLPSGAETHTADIRLLLQAKHEGTFRPIPSVTIRDQNGRIFTPALNATGGALDIVPEVIPTTDKTISSFEPLEPSVKTQKVAYLTPEASLNLPRLLKAVVDGVSGAFVRVSEWVSDISYNPIQAGEYNFTPVLDSGYVVDSGAHIPAIKVIVSPKQPEKPNPDPGHHSGGRSSSGSSHTPPSLPSGVTVTPGPAGGTLVTAEPAPDGAPVVSGSRSVLSATVPDEVSAFISGATAEHPVTVKVTAPTGAMVAQLKDGAVKALELSLRLPSAALRRSNAYAAVSVEVSAAVLQAAKDAQKDLVFHLVDAQTGAVYSTWSFTGAGLRNSAAAMSGVNLTVTIEPIQSNPAIAEAAGAGPAGQGLILKFGGSGLLPAPAAVKVRVGSPGGILPNSKVYLYLFNETANIPEQLPRSEYTVDAEGYVTLSIARCANYVLLPKAAAHVYPVQSDTTYLTGVPNGKAYTAAITVSGNATPSFTVGNGGAFSSTIKKEGNRYFFMVKAAGPVGTTTAVYCTLPNQKPVVLYYLSIVK